MAPPPPQGYAPGKMAPPPPGGFGGPYGGPHQQVLENFSELTLGGAGGPEMADPVAFPRPTGPEREAALAPAKCFERANCSSDNMRATVNAIPNSTALRARWALPLGLIVQPMADDAKGRAVPVVGLSSTGIVRCRRCRTYVNPFVQWLDGGRRYKCNVCAMLNDIPADYFCPLDQSGRRHDHDSRPELAHGTVEYIAPAEYMVRPPMPPTYFFLLDVSYAAISSGLLAAACSSLRQCLDHLPGDERTLFGLITFDSTLHFYNLKSGLSTPQMLVVPELDDPFVPLPDDLLVNLQVAL